MSHTRGVVHAWVGAQAAYVTCGSSKGASCYTTEKCEHIKYNPNVVMYWYHQIPEEDYVPGVNDYFNSYGVQIKGTARTLSLEDEGAAEFASAYMATMRGAEAWGAVSEEDKQATIEKLFQYNDWIEITPTEYIANSLNWSFNVENSRRPEWYDPESPYFGKSVRQELNL